MVARTLLFKVAIAAPILTTAFIGVESQLLRDDFNPIRIDAAIDDRIFDYVPHLLAIDAIPSAGSSKKTDVERISQEWIRATENGTLKSLYPSFYGEGIEDGPKCQALTAAIRLSNLCCSKAHDAARDKNFEEAFKFLDYSIHIMETVKYSDFDALRIASNRQSRSVMHVKSGFGTELEKHQPRIRQIVDRYRVDGRRVDNLVRHVKSIYTQYAERYRDVDRNLLDERKFGDMLKAIQIDARRIYDNSGSAMSQLEMKISDQPECVRKARVALMEIHRSHRNLMGETGPDLFAAKKTYDFSTRVEGDPGHEIAASGFAPDPR